MSATQPENNQWISLIDQQPGDDQLPVWYCNQPAGTVWHSHSRGPERATHWKPAERKPAPPRAKTRAELDQEQYELFRDHCRNKGMCDWNSFRAALAYERAEIEKLLPQGGNGERITAFEIVLRNRVKGGAS